MGNNNSKENKNNLTTGNVKKTMLRFALPYLLACFLQTFYGLADLFVVGLYNSTEVTNAVSIGSQIMHMFTVMVAGLAMGATVEIGRSIGAKDYKKAKRMTGTTAVMFTVFALVCTLILLVSAKGIVSIMNTPSESVKETTSYVRICFGGFPFIVAYNVISSIYRGAGDSKRPMIFVGIACVANIILDFVFIGGMGLGASGAALGTVCGQAISVLVSLMFISRIGLGFKLELKDLRFEKTSFFSIFRVGFPISIQDGIIQVAFIVITIFANNRGLTDSTAVGIVEKLISFMFLVPSAFLSSISAITAQNMGAGKADRARESLRFGLIITVSWGIVCGLYCSVFPETLIQIFRKEPEIIASGCQYLRSYSWDCALAAIHFCFSGYFCGMQKSQYSFIHNLLSAVLVRIPGSYYASITFADTIFPMGMAAPAGSFLSVIICLILYLNLTKGDGKILPHGN